MYDAVSIANKDRKRGGVDLGVVISSCSGQWHLSIYQHLHASSVVVTDRKELVLPMHPTTHKTVPHKNYQPSQSGMLK